MSSRVGLVKSSTELLALKQATLKQEEAWRRARARKHWRDLRSHVRGGAFRRRSGSDSGVGLRLPTPRGRSLRAGGLGSRRASFHTLRLEWQLQRGEGLSRGQRCRARAALAARRALLGVIPVESPVRVAWDALILVRCMHLLAPIPNTSTV